MPVETVAAPANDWHALEAAEVLAHLRSDARFGLAAEEAARRLERDGPNRLPAPPRRGAWRRLALQFHNLLIYLMLAAAAITAALGHWIDTGVLLGAVLVNAVIGFVQEGKAESALDAIRRMLTLRSAVLRGGMRQTVNAESLVAGDIVLLASGDKVPADVRLVEARGVRADEAALTGESVPVDKSVDAVAAASPLADRRGMLHSGTLVTAGSAVGVVVATGRASEIGRIGRLLADVPEQTTPLLRQVAVFGRWLGIAILALAAATFLLGVAVRGQAAGEMFVMVVALAASAIPEGLPAIMTVTLALGVRRMASRRAIVRRLPAVETLGAVTVICSDKTGTLTRNEMTAQRVVTAARVYDVSGAGYAPDGGFESGGRAVSAADEPVLQEAARAAVLCNDAVLHAGADGWRLEGDPTEGALVTLALKAGLDAAGERVARPRTDSVPFESERRFMATLHHDHAGHGWVVVKGAPERVLEICSAQRGAGGDAPLDPDHWRRAMNDLAARALRVLALAVKAVPAGHVELELDDCDSGYTLLALVGSSDPPRAEAQAAVADCRAAGVRVKMITGDHAETARAIGATLGIGAGRPALTGAEIELMDDAALRRVVHEVDVFARASPEHKLRLVAALQARGEVVAMTGDGVNDAPALKRADVGVAMGLKGTEAAKEAGAIVLADDHFATIVGAVREGRGVHDNILKFILFMLPTNGGEALVVLAAIVFGLVLPLTPAQVLWINLATSSTLGLALAFEPPEAGVMRRPPRPPGQPLLKPLFVWRVVWVSLLMMAGALGLFLWELERGAPLERARTVAVNAVVVAEMFYLLNSRFIAQPVLTRAGLFGNPYVWASIAVAVVLQLLYTYAGPLQRVFGSTSLGAGEWLRVLGVGVVLFVAAELEKAVLRGWRARAARAAPIAKENTA